MKTISSLTLTIKSNNL